jgi:hypothetical protein
MPSAHVGKGKRLGSAGILSERVEALGASGHTTWTPVVGLADETSGDAVLCSISVVRSSRRQPSTTGGPGGDDLTLGGGISKDFVNVWMKLEQAVKIIWAQN